MIPDDDNSPYEWAWTAKKWRAMAAEHDQRADAAKADGDTADEADWRIKAIDCRRYARGKEHRDRAIAAGRAALANATKEDWDGP